MAEVATAPANRKKLVAGPEPRHRRDGGGPRGADRRADASASTMPTEFVVPGENRPSAALDVARTVVRRAERVAVSLPMPRLAGRARTSTGCPTSSGRWPAWQEGDGPPDGAEAVRSTTRGRSADGTHGDGGVGRPVERPRWRRSGCRGRRGRRRRGAGAPRRGRGRRWPGATCPSTSTRAWCERQGFTAKPGQVATLESSPGGPKVVARRARRPRAIDPERWRRARGRLRPERR